MWNRNKIIAKSHKTAFFVWNFDEILMGGMESGDISRSFKAASKLSTDLDLIEKMMQICIWSNVRWIIYQIKVLPFLSLDLSEGSPLYKAQKHIIGMKAEAYRGQPYI